MERAGPCVLGVEVKFLSKLPLEHQKRATANRLIRNRPISRPGKETKKTRSGKEKKKEQEKKKTGREDKAKRSSFNLMSVPAKRRRVILPAPGAQPSGSFPSTSSSLVATPSLQPSASGRGSTGGSGSSEESLLGNDTSRDLQSRSQSIDSSSADAKKPRAASKRQVIAVACDNCRRRKAKVSETITDTNLFSLSLQERRRGFGHHDPRLRDFTVRRPSAKMPTLLQKGRRVPL